MLVHLVRHGPPAIDRTLAASAWPLDPAQLASVDRLRDAAVLPTQAAVWFSSSEPKAIQTSARLYDGDVIARDELCEAARPAEWIDRASFVDAVSRSLLVPLEPARPGWETSADVRARVVGLLGGEISRQVFAAGADQVVLVGHGTAWTILVGALCGEPLDLAAWRAMTMPDHCLLDLQRDREDGRETSRPSRATIVRSWGSWRDS